MRLRSGLLNQFEEMVFHGVFIPLGRSFGADLEIQGGGEAGDVGGVAFVAGGYDLPAGGEFVGRKRGGAILEWSLAEAFAVGEEGNGTCGGSAGDGGGKDADFARLE